MRNSCNTQGTRFTFPEFKKKLKGPTAKMLGDGSQLFSHRETNTVCVDPRNLHLNGLLTLSTAIVYFCL